MIHLFGTLSLFGYIALAVLGNNGDPQRIGWVLFLWMLLFLPYAGLARRILRRPEKIELESPTGSPSHRPLLPILVWALLFRIALLPAGLPPYDPVGHLAADLQGTEAGFQPFLLWDNDVWRYLWEGHMVAAGVSPYRFSPEEVLSAADRGEVWAEELVESDPWPDVLDRISYRDFSTVYPPLALLLFRTSHLLAPGSVLVWKALLVGLEFVGCLLFASLLAKIRKPPELSLLLAWNPLLIKEVAGSGHIDGVLIPLFLAALVFSSERRETSTAIAASAAVLLKLWPILLVPALLVRQSWKRWWPLPAALIASYWPYRQDLQEMASGLRAFSSNWVFNPGPWLLTEEISHRLGVGGRALPDLVHWGLTLMLVAATAWIALKRRNLLARASPQQLVLPIFRDWFLIGAAFLLFSATVMPWYLLPLLPIAIVYGAWPWLVTTGVAILSYGIYVSGTEHGWVLTVEFTFSLMAFVWWKKSTLRSLLGKVTTSGRVAR